MSSSLFLQILDRFIDINLIIVNKCLETLPFQIFCSDNILIIYNTALSYGLGAIRDQIIHIHLLRDAKSLAVVTGTKRCIEGKQPRAPASEC